MFAAPHRTARGPAARVPAVPPGRTSERDA
jgi:hypothetical protein